MPRIIEGRRERRKVNARLVAALADELRESHEFGQPLIREHRFPTTNAIRTTVIWDKWQKLSDEDRVEVILQAYESVEGKDFRDRLALVIGLTVPEAHATGMLPVQVIAALRDGDPVSPEECREAMVQQGASLIEDPKRPVLRFATVREAEQCIRRLTEILPGSNNVWIVNQEVDRNVD